MQKSDEEILRAVREEFGALKDCTMKAVREDFDRLGENNVRGVVEYILVEKAEELEERSNDGHSVDVRDAGHGGMTLKDFHDKPQSQKAKLKLAHVAALRIYTSCLFVFINRPFRATGGNFKDE